MIRCRKRSFQKGAFNFSLLTLICPYLFDKNNKIIFLSFTVALLVHWPWTLFHTSRSLPGCCCALSPRLQPLVPRPFDRPHACHHLVSQELPMGVLGFARSCTESTSNTCISSSWGSSCCCPGTPSLPAAYTPSCWLAVSWSWGWQSGNFLPHLNLCSQITARSEKLQMQEMAAKPPQRRVCGSGHGSQGWKPSSGLEVQDAL